MNESGKAVFLSYAREDTDAARRIADALRGFGVEVWFDQSELRGGDAWDARIRTQINDCTLFLPIISTHTQERGKGYFRLEWKLAVDQTHLMAEGMAFLAPVVVDDTPESGAIVPPEFMKVQWTRLPGALPTPQFVEQVKRLLAGQALTAGRPGSAVAGVGDPGRPDPRPGSAARTGRKPAFPGSAWGALAAMVVAIAAGVVFLRKPAHVVPPAAQSPARSLSPALATPGATDKSIAVLPFTNMSEDKDNAFFADGIHEDILTNLALVRELRVVSRTSVMEYRNTTKNIRQIAGELGVAYILEGSVQRAGNQVRVTGQLIDARTDEHLWAQAYDRDLTDVFAIQSEISKQIAVALATALSPEEQKLIERRPTENVAAYDAYAKARQILQSGSQIGFNNLVPLLQTAVLLDPKFAQAWAELGSVYARRYFDDWEHTAEVLAKAKAAIDTAVSLAPEDPTVISKVGDYYYYGLRDYPRAAEQYQRLARLYPNSAQAFASLAFIHRRQGRWSEALGELRRAVQLEPRNVRYSAALVETALALKRYGEAEALQRQIVAQVPDSPRQAIALAFIPLLARGSSDEIRATLAELAAEPKNAGRAPFIRARIAAITGDLESQLSFARQQREEKMAGDPAWSDEVDYAGLLWLHGDKAEARAVAEKALARGKAEATNQPSAKTWATLSTAYAVLEDRAGALRCAQAAKDLLPESKDAWDGPNFSLNYAETLAWFGEKDQALAELKRLLRTPNGANVHQLRRDPNWRLLQGDARFEALLGDPANNAPLL